MDTRSAESLELLQYVRGISDGTQDVDVRPAFPPTRTGESTSSGGIVVHSADVVERPGPSIFRLATDTVRPCGDGSEVALASVVEDITELRHHAWVQMHLRDGRDDLMTCELIQWRSEWEKQCVRGRVPTAPQAYVCGIRAAPSTSGSSDEKRMLV